MLPIIAAFLAVGCSKEDRRPPPPEDDLARMKEQLLAHLDETCEGAALAAVRSAGAACPSWHVHGEAPAGTPRDLARASVLVSCDAPHASFLVRLGSGEVLSLADPSRPVALDASPASSRAAARACEHVYD